MLKKLIKFIIALSLFYAFSAFSISQILDAPVNLTASTDGITFIRADAKNNTIGIVYISGPNLYLLYSLNNEDNWSNPIKLSQNAATSASISIGNNGKETENNFALMFKRCESNCTV